MNCVVCKEPMIVLELDEVEIDHCLECGGIWLDFGELEQLLDDANAMEKMLKQSSADQRNKQGDRKCPICGKRMEIVTVGSEKNIRIDRCPRSHGLWFDKGELSDIITIFGGDKQGKVIKLLKEMFND